VVFIKGAEGEGEEAIDEHFQESVLIIIHCRHVKGFSLVVLANFSFSCCIYCSSVVLHGVAPYSSSRVSCYLPDYKMDGVKDLMMAFRMLACKDSSPLTAGGRTLPLQKGN
jgi:hypothetical protein